MDGQIGDQDMLNQFFDTLKIRYNHGHDIDPLIKKKIERHIEYWWIHDRNQAIDDPDEQAYLD